MLAGSHLHKRIQMSLSRSLILGLFANFVFRKLVKNAAHDADFPLASQFIDVFPGAILDIGANSGLSTRFFCKAHPDREVVAFEPNHLLHRHLSRLSCPNVDVHLVALGDDEAMLELAVPSILWMHLETAGTFVPKVVHNDFADRPLIWRRLLRFNQIRVSCQTLDSFGLSAGFIKIDVEGFEVRVLRGATRTISVNRPLILIEFTSDAKGIMQLLQAQDYRLFVNQNGSLVELKSLTTPSTNRNIFAFPEEKVELIETICHRGTSALER